MTSADNGHQVLVTTLFTVQTGTQGLAVTTLTPKSEDDNNNRACTFAGIVVLDNVRTLVPLQHWDVWKPALLTIGWFACCSTVRNAAHTFFALSSTLNTTEEKP